MDHQDLELRLRISMPEGSAASTVLDKMARTTKLLSDAEEEYQKRLDKRIRGLHEQQRIQRDLEQLGLRQSREEKEQLRLEKDRERERKRMAYTTQREATERRWATGVALVGGRPITAAATALGGMRFGMGAGLAMEAVSHLGGAATTGINALQNTSLNSAQRERAFARGIGLGGVIDLVDAASGRTEGLRQIREEVDPKRAVQRHYEQAAAMALIPKTQAFNSAAIRADVTSGAQLPNAGPLARTTLGEQIAYRENQRLLPLLDERVRREREVEIAKREQATSTKRLLDLDEERVRLERQHRMLQGVADRGRADAAHANVTSRLLDTSTRLMNLPERRRALVGEVETARQRVVEQQSGLRQTNVSIQGEGLGILQAREEKAQSQAQRLGGMSEWEFQTGVQAFQAIKENGIQNVPPHLRQVASHFLPEATASLAEQAFAKSDRFEQIQQLGPEAQAEVRDRLGDVRKKADEQQGGMRQGGLENEKETSAELRDALRPIAQLIANAFKDEMKAAMDQVRDMLQHARAQQY